MALVSFAAIFLLAVLSYVAVRSYKVSAGGWRERVQAAMKLMKGRWRLLIVTTWMCLCVGYPVVLFIYTEANSTALPKNIIAYTECVFKNGGSHCHPEMIYPFGVYLVGIVIPFTQGIVFGTVFFDRKLVTFARLLALRRSVSLASNSARSTPVVSLSIGHEY